MRLFPYLSMLAIVPALQIAAAPDLSFHEAVFGHYWWPDHFPERRVVDESEKFRRNVRSWHQRILMTAKTPSDRQKEQRILLNIDAINTNASLYSHRRVTCRAGLCEYVVILRRSVPFETGKSVIGKLQGNNSRICRADICTWYVVMSGSEQREDGVAMLVYLIDKSTTEK